MARRISILLALAGAALLVVEWQWGRMLWLDEEMIAINIRDRSMGQLAGPLSLGQAAPYVWLLAERALLLTFGTGERVLRLLPVACGIATLGTALWIGRRWMQSAGASMLVLLCAAGQWVSFHALELKHYSADIWFGLLLPALVVWALEDDDGRPTIDRRRIVVWWTVAAGAQWLANGALFVTPACVIVLVVTAFRRARWKGALEAAAPGVIWLAVFGVNYVVALAPARGSDFLRAYWTNAFPPHDVGVVGTLQWLAAQLQPLAVKPIGTGFGLLFWAVAVAGLCGAPGYSPAFRWVFALVPLSAFVWAGVGLVPMFERLSLWMVPAVYVGVAMGAEAVVRWLQDAWARRSVWRGAIGTAAALFFVVLAADIINRGTTYMLVAEPTSNHELDDRGAVRWLARQRRPGDVWVTTRNALPAIWWYANPDDPASVVEASYRWSAGQCGRDEIVRSLGAAGARRALVYLGFGHEIPPEFDDAIVARLSGAGSIVGYRMFGETSHALIVDFGARSAAPVTLASLRRGTNPPVALAVAGCVAVEPARPW